MTHWRRPFARLLAGLLVVALAWALLPAPAQAHHEGAGDATAAVAALDAPARHEVGPGLPCGPQAACSPTLLLQRVANPAFAAPWRSRRVRPQDDRRTHLHRRGLDLPPPRRPA